MDKKDKVKKYSPEIKERAVRMVLECRPDHPSRWSAVESIGCQVRCQVFHYHIIRPMPFFLTAKEENYPPMPSVVGVVMSVEFFSR